MTRLAAHVGVQCVIVGSLSRACAWGLAIAWSCCIQTSCEIATKCCREADSNANFEPSGPSFGKADANRPMCIVAATCHRGAGTPLLLDRLPHA